MNRICRKLVTWMVLSALVLSVFGCGPKQPKDAEEVITTPEPERLNILLLGVDARPGEKAARADSIILASIDQETRLISLLSIPRDTRVKIPGHGWQKINAATAFGGPELLREVVEDLVGIKIDHHVMTNFEGFKDIVDTLGGVTVDVDRDMYYNSDDVRINLKKGIQKLDGEKALQYVRYRKYALGDIERTRHQLEFMKALVQEILQLKTLLKLPKLIPQMLQAVETDLGLKSILALIDVARDLDQDNIMTQTLPGRFASIDGISYWDVDPEEAQQVASLLLAGVVTPEVVTGPGLTDGQDRDNGKVKDKPTGSNETGRPENEGPGDGASNEPVPPGENSGFPAPPEHGPGGEAQPPDKPVPDEPPAPGEGSPPEDQGGETLSAPGAGVLDPEPANQPGVMFLRV